MADHVAPALEAILMVAEEPLPPVLLAKLEEQKRQERRAREGTIGDMNSLFAPATLISASQNTVPSGAGAGAGAGARMF